MRCDSGFGRLAAILVVDVFCVAMMAGCVGYRLGSSLPKGLSTIYVPTFINKCNEPQIENDATDATKSEFQRDGSLSLVGEGEADLILEVTLVKYALEALRFERADTKTAKEYRLILTADIVLTQTKPKRVLLKRRVEGKSTFYPGADLTSAKRAALPKTTTDLAHMIVESSSEAW